MVCTTASPKRWTRLSQRLGLTRERVRQVQNEALLKLKRHYRPPRHHARRVDVAHAPPLRGSLPPGGNFLGAACGE